MSKHYLQYWRAAQVIRERQSPNPFVEHSGSEQLYKVNPNDTVWIVTVMNGELLLLGKIQVGAIVGQKEAEELLGTDNLWEATYHIIAKRGMAEPMRDINLMDIASQLRFNSPTGRDRLSISRGRADGKQLQAMRQLTAESVGLLEAKWSGSNLVSEFEESVRKGAGFGNPETNRKVEKAAISFVTQWYEARGWKVKSVEVEKRGYDLLCTKGKSEEHVEVKGIQGREPTFIITADEVRQAQTNSNFIICIVTAALTEKPQMSRYNGANLMKKFNLAPLAYRANLISE